MNLNPSQPGYLPRREGRDGNGTLPPLHVTTRREFLTKAVGAGVLVATAGTDAIHSVDRTRG